MKKVIRITPRFIRASENLKRLIKERAKLENKIIEAEMEYKHAKYEMENA